MLKAKLYADDVLLYSYNIICSEMDCHVLPQDLDALKHWAHTWQMEFNPKKCESIRITNKRNIFFTIITLSLSLLTKSHTQNILV